MKKIQIGIMGSAADLNYGNDAKEFAKKLGKLIAKSGNILIYGAEKEYGSLSTNAAMEAKKNSGLTVVFPVDRIKEVVNDEMLRVKSEFQKQLITVK